VAISNPFNVNISNFDLPVVIGPSSVCVGTEATYSTPFNGGRTYRWNVSGGVIVSGQGTFSVVVAWGFLGAGSVSVFDSVDASGCNGTSLPMVVSVTDKPTALISGANSLCADAVSNYGTIPGANKFYTWGALGGTILSGQGTSMATINWDVPGTGYVFLYDSLIGSSCAAYAVKEVAVNPNPSAAFTTSQSMGGITLTPAEPNLQTKWYFGDGDSSTQYAPTHFYASNGTYTVNFIAKTLKGCTNTSSTDVNISTVSIAKYLANGSINFTAYPNPFMGATTVSLSLSETAEIGIDLYDMSGRLVKTLAEPNIKTAGDYEYAVMSEDLNSQNGMYLVRLKLNDQYHYLKIAEMGK
jgi:PKD repeat protein